MANPRRTVGELCAITCTATQRDRRGSNIFNPGQTKGLCPCRARRATAAEVAAGIRARTALGNSPWKAHPGASRILRELPLLVPFDVRLIESVQCIEEIRLE
jgi:hypothetical protein